MQRRHKGFSLVEIMVGLMIGVVAMIIIMQVFSVTEGTKRTTTGGADAHTNGATSLYLIERDLRMAGWGLEPWLYLGKQMVAGVQSYEPGCTTLRTYCDGSAACGGSTGAIAGFSLAGVTIQEGGANPDALTVRFFSNPGADNFIPSTNMEFLSDNGIPPKTLPTKSLTVASAAGCSGPTNAVTKTGGSLLLISDPTNGVCTVMQATKITLPLPPAQPFSTIEHDGGDGYNPSAGWPAPTPTSSARISCFSPAANGPVFRRTYSVDVTTRQLVKTDNTVVPAVANEPVASGIFDLQAQYGIAPDSVQEVNAWVNASGEWANPAPATLGGAGRLQRIKAVRVAVLARSSQYEKPDSAGICSATTAAMTALWPKWNGVAVFNTANYPAGWDCYRYKVLETISPLRNVIWGNV